MSLSPFGTEIDTSVFPASYANARQTWLSLITEVEHPVRHEIYQCAGLGPNGESLLTDIAWIGDENADNLVVVIAATHGVEGFAGSAIQLDLLQGVSKRQLDIPSDTAILLIHALTPWGYAWSRRCDADGVDLNRNAVDFSQPLPDNPDYDKLRDWLFVADAAQRQQAFADFSRQYGRVALEKAISGGQYRDPSGPFYGGRAPAHGRLVCEDLIQRHNLAQRRVAVVDLHTGLGPYGYGEIICDHQPDSAGAAVAQSWYGDSVTLPLAGTSSSVPKLGLLDYLWHANMNRESCYVTLEFGTYSTDHLFEVLLRDHQLWAEENNHDQRFEHSMVMRQHFCPNENAWQEMVLFRARQVLGQALRGVSS